MKNILVISTHTDIEERLQNMLEKKQIPPANFSIIVEFFGEEEVSKGYFKNVFSIDDLRSRQAIEEAILTAKSWGIFDQVIATDEYAVILAAEIRERLNVSGPNQNEILIYRDKVRMKEKLIGSKVLVPKLFSFEQLENDSSLFPAIMKPKSYGGSKGVKILKCQDDLRFAPQKAKISNENKQSIFQEFDIDDVEFEELIDGDIYHIDGLVFDGQIIFSIASQYEGTCLDFLQGLPLGSYSLEDKNEQNLWTAFAADVNGAMKIPNGAFHLEAFINKRGQRIFLEIGIRPGGALVVPAIEKAVGVNLDVAHLQCQLGLKPNIDDLKNNQFGWLIFPKKEKVDSKTKVSNVVIPAFNNILAPIIHKLPSIGENMEGSFSYTATLGSFVFVGQDQQSVTESLNYVLNHYLVEASGAV